MKKLLIFFIPFVLLSSCSEPENLVDDQANFRSAQLALDLQQFGVSLATNGEVQQKQLDILSNSINVYSKDFTEQHQRAAGDFKDVSISTSQFRDMQSAFSSPFASLQNYLRDTGSLDRKQLEKMLPGVPSAVKDMVFPLLQTSQKLYSLDETSTSNIKKITKDLEQQVKTIRKQADSLPDSLKNGALVLGDVVEAINWAAEPFYAGSALGSLAWQQQPYILTRGNSEGECSPFKSIFYAIARRIPNALVGAVQGALTAVKEKKSGGDVLTSSLVGAAQGFLKSPEEEKKAETPSEGTEPVAAEAAT